MSLTALNLLINDANSTAISFGSDLTDIAGPIAITYGLNYTTADRFGASA